jgi:hypothetical protein
VFAGMRSIPNRRSFVVRVHLLALSLMPMDPIQCKQAVSPKTLYFSLRVLKYMCLQCNDIHKKPVENWPARGQKRAEKWLPETLLATPRREKSRPSRL